MGVEKQKGFKVEYCHVNDEYVAMLKDTPFMGVAATIDEAIAQLESDVARGENDATEISETPPETAAAAAAEAPPADYASFGGDDDEDGGETEDEAEDAEDDDDRSTPPA